MGYVRRYKLRGTNYETAWQPSRKAGSKAGQIAKILLNFHNSVFEL